MVAAVEKHHCRNAAIWTTVQALFIAINSYMTHLFLICIWFLTLLLSPLPLNAKEREPEHERPRPVAGTLERVIDGDTFVSFGKSIRLWGIDAPEKGDKHYLASKLYLEVILQKQPFSCHYKHKDRYQRLVMQCFSNKVDIARLMVRMGMARDYFKYSNGEYAEDEKFAKEMKYGVWSE